MPDLRSPTQAQVIRTALEMFAAGIFVCRPGQIQKVDQSTLLCDVKPLLKELREDASGATVIEPLPVVPGCVLYFGEGGGFVDTFPVQKGDACWLIFADRSTAQWQRTGGDTDPVFTNRHDLSGAVVIVGGRAKANVIAEFDPARRVIGKQGKPRIALSDTNIHLGVDHLEDAVEPVILGQKYTDDEKVTFHQISNHLIFAKVALETAQAQLTAAASANAVPYTGGAAAASSFVNAAVALGQAATSLDNASNEFINFAGNQASRLSQIVKVK